MEAAGHCCVKVAVHVRPLIADERLQGCKDCVSVVPGTPQVQIGAHSFTFDHVYGSRGCPSHAMFEECIAPLVDGLFQGYNATVLAYGQTGSGKTYTMGTGFNDGFNKGLVPQVMSALFNKIDVLKHHTEFQVHVSFIEILKEEVRDLLDYTSMSKSETTNGHAGKVTVPGRLPIQIRETSDGVITLAGSTEVAVSTLREMAGCLEQGSLSRATGSTNMNNQSSLHEDVGEEYLYAKLHLVDLAGSERAKRTGTDGLRFKEGVHINRGLLALGNVISALGDEKKQKDGVHVPYRDSKLTRLLQDSLGGNSKTVMIACVSPADINVEETLNTLKYANRARNIQNMPIVNRDLVSNEMQKMRQKLEYLQAELSACMGGTSSDEMQVLREKISWLEAANENLCQELHEYRSRCGVRGTNAPECHMSLPKNENAKKGMQSDVLSDCTILKSAVTEINEVAAKEWEHALLQNTMDEELIELNKCLEQKESETKHFGGLETEALKQHFVKKIMELEEEKRTVQLERDHLFAEIENLAASSDGQARKMENIHAHKLKSLEAQILDLKKKQKNQVQLLKQKQRSDEAAKRLQDEIQYIKAQKVKLQNKIKKEVEQFHHWKASHEKELLQLRKEGRRNEHERDKLQALNQRERMVLHRKTEEVAMATKRLKELLEARKSSACDHYVNSNKHLPSEQSNEKTLQQWLEHELEVMANVHEVRIEYEKQSQVRAALAEELALLKQADKPLANGLSPLRGKNGYSRMPSMSPNARMTRIASLEHMLSISSNALVAMALQLSKAEEQYRGFSSRGCWNHLRSMGDAKNLLQYTYNATADARCELWEKEREVKVMKEQQNGLVNLLRQSEAMRKEIVKDQKLKDQAVTIAMATSASGTPRSSLKHFADDMSGPLYPISLPAPKQLKFTAVAKGSTRDHAIFLDQTQKGMSMGQLPIKKLAVVGQAGKLWRWKRSHHQWLLQFKWKWQKPWKLSEWIKHSNETIMNSKPRSQALADIIR